MRSREASVYLVDDDASPREAVVGLAPSAEPNARGLASVPACSSASRLGHVAPGIVGCSAPLRAALQHVRAVADTDATVLIQGETGTGKERVARAVHALSRRASGPFVTVNCAAIPANLLESELMGHERGAFTGAASQRIGRFELARDGTIFLDELGELPLELQPKLLRVLQEREFERLGSSRTLRTNARVIAATHRDLGAMARLRTFREDLYYRLSVFPIRVPPLRERREDIEPIAHHFLRELAGRMGRRVGRLSARSLEHLLAYDWPGNVRELQNVLERAVIVSAGDSLEVPPLGGYAELPEALVEGAEVATPAGSPAASAPLSSQSFDAVTRAHILRVLHETNWVIAGPHGAAAKLQMKRTTLNFRMKKLGIVRQAHG